MVEGIKVRGVKGLTSILDAPFGCDDWKLFLGQVKLSEEFGLLLVKGDNVLIKRDSGVSIKQFENEYKIIEENDILAKIT